MVATYHKKARIHEALKVNFKTFKYETKTDFDTISDVRSDSGDKHGCFSKTIINKK